VALKAATSEFYQGSEGQSSVNWKNEKLELGNFQKH